MIYLGAKINKLSMKYDVFKGYESRETCYITRLVYFKIEGVLDMLGIFGLRLIFVLPIFLATSIVTGCFGLRPKLALPIFGNFNSV